jgi:hypothetical protein
MLMKIHLRMNQVEIKKCTSTSSACQTMAPELQVENKELGCECEGRILKKVHTRENTLNLFPLYF